MTGWIPGLLLFLASWVLLDAIVVTIWAAMKAWARWRARREPDEAQDVGDYGERIA